MRVYTALWMIHALAPFVPVVKDGDPDPKVEIWRELIRDEGRRQEPVFAEVKP